MSSPNAPIIELVGALRMRRLEDRTTERSAAMYQESDVADGGRAYYYALSPPYTRFLSHPALKRNNPHSECPHRPDKDSMMHKSP